MLIYDDISEDMARELAFTKEEVERLNAAKEKPIVFDEDCPEVTPEQASQFVRVHVPANV